jgi:hypothetical protein
MFHAPYGEVSCSAFQAARAFARCYCFSLRCRCPTPSLKQRPRARPRLSRPRQPAGRQHRADRATRGFVVVHAKPRTVVQFGRGDRRQRRPGRPAQGPDQRQHDAGRPEIFVTGDLSRALACALRRYAQDGRQLHVSRRPLTLEQADGLRACPPLRRDNLGGGSGDLQIFSRRTGVPDRERGFSSVDRNAPPPMDMDGVDRPCVRSAFRRRLGVVARGRYLRRICRRCVARRGRLDRRHPNPLRPSLVVALRTWRSARSADRGAHAGAHERGSHERGSHERGSHERGEARPARRLRSCSPSAS